MKRRPRDPWILNTPVPPLSHDVAISTELYDVMRTIRETGIATLHI